MSELLDKLNECKDEEFARFSRGIIKTDYQILGVRTPMLRKLARQEYMTSGLEILKTNSQIYEVNLLKGMIVSMLEYEQMKKHINSYLKLVDNWAMIDLVFTNLKIGEDSLDFFKKYAGSKEEFYARFGIVGLLKCFRQNNDYERVIEALNGVVCEKYNCLMAEAWLISEILIRNPQNAEKIMQKIIKNPHFNREMIKKAIQKACDSYRLDKNLKQRLRKLNEQK